jgi:hypothetical protein
LRIDGRDQAVPAGPFGWKNQPRVKIHSWFTSDSEDTLDAECSYAGFTHRRCFRLVRAQAVLYVSDEVTGPAGEHEVEQFWLLGSEQARQRILLPEGAEEIEGWASSVYAEKHRVPALRVVKRGPLPMRFEASILLSPSL